MSKWLPIETAPKDGTEFLGYNPDLFGVCLAQWDTKGWFVDKDAQGGGGFENVELTHWMPLPKPPGPNEAATENIIPIPTYNLKDVPASLRRLADGLEQGEDPEAVHAMVVAVGHSDEMRIYGYGEVGTLAHEVGTLQMAALKLANLGLSPGEQ